MTGPAAHANVGTELLGSQGPRCCWLRCLRLPVWDHPFPGWVTDIKVNKRIRRDVCPKTSGIQSAKGLSCGRGARGPGSAGDSRQRRARLRPGGVLVRLAGGCWLGTSRPVGSAPLGFPFRVSFPHEVEPHPHLPRAAGPSRLGDSCPPCPTPWHVLLLPVAGLACRFGPHWAAPRRPPRSLSGLLRPSSCPAPLTPATSGMDLEKGRATGQKVPWR